MQFHDSHVPSVLVREQHRAEGVLIDYGDDPAARPQVHPQPVTSLILEVRIQGTRERRPLEWFDGPCNGYRPGALVDLFA